MQAVLKAAGGDLDDIVKLSILLADLGDFAKVNDLMTKRFRQPYPARSTYQVAALPRGARIEVEAIADAEGALAPGSVRGRIDQIGLRARSASPRRIVGVRVERGIERRREELEVAEVERLADQRERRCADRPATRRRRRGARANSRGSASAHARSSASAPAASPCAARTIARLTSTAGKSGSCARGFVDERPPRAPRCRRRARSGLRRAATQTLDSPDARQSDHAARASSRRRA